MAEVGFASDLKKEVTVLTERSGSSENFNHVLHEGRCCKPTSARRWTTTTNRRLWTNTSWTITKERNRSHFYWLFNESHGLVEKCWAIEDASVSRDSKWI